MSGEHFTLTISQSSSNSGDFAIHLKDRNRKKEHFLMHLCFPENSIIDTHFMDDIVSMITRCIAKRLVTQDIEEEPMTSQDAISAKKVIDLALDKIKKSH